MQKLNFENLVKGEEIVPKRIEVKTDHYERHELSDETLQDIKEAREDIRKGRVYTSKQLKKELDL